jgi:hypothetical protein
MSKYDNTDVPHINEILGLPHIDPDKCDYCERGWNKGFTSCPSCGTKCPDDYWDEE